MDVSIPMDPGTTGNEREKVNFKASTLASVTQLTLTFGCYLVFSIAANATFGASAWLYGGLVITAALFVVRLFIIQHDCSHLSFFANKQTNQFIGRCLGVFTLVPFFYWQRKHNLHHATSGNLDKRGEGDIWMLTLAEYQAAPSRLRWQYRLYRNPFVMLVLGAFVQFIVKFRLPQIAPAKWQRERRDIHLNNLMIAIYITGLISLFGWQTAIITFLLIGGIAGSVGIFLFYVQHQFEDGYWVSSEAWDRKQAALAGSSYLHLPKWFNWLTGHIALHHVHHLNAHIPNYNLAAYMHAKQLDKDGFQLSFKTAVACLFLHLWDEEQQRLISFTDIEGRKS